MLLLSYKPASQTASQPASQQASLRASKPASQTARLPASQPASWLLSGCVLVAMNILTPQSLAPMRAKVWQTWGPNADRNVCQNGFNWDPMNMLLNNS
jgi:hypothetical protein